MFALYLFSQAAEGGPDPALSWIFFIGLGLFFLMIVIGWVTSSVQQNQQNARNETPNSRGHK